MRRSSVVIACLGLLGVSGLAVSGIAVSGLDLPGRMYPATRTTYFADAGKHGWWEAGQTAAIRELSSGLHKSPSSLRYSIVYEKIPKHAFGIVPRQLLAYNRKALRLMHGDEEAPERCTVLTNVTPELIHEVAAKGGDFAALQRRCQADPGTRKGGTK